MNALPIFVRLPGWRAWAAGGLLAACLAGLLCFSAVAAIVGASLASCASPNEAAFTGSQEAPSATALAQISPERLRLYEQAGQRFNLDWSFLASIGTQECGEGLCEGINGSGCAGPMQIADVPNTPCSPGAGPTLWERFKVNADPGQPVSPNDLADAIFTAARILRQDMGAPPAGGSYQAYYQAACRYYGACATGTVDYANEVIDRAVSYGFAGPGTPASSSTTSQPAAAQPSTGCSSIVFTGSPAGRQRIVKTAESQVGQAEHPPGTGCTVYGPCEEWCSLFAAWVWQHAGIPLEGPTALYGYSGSLYTWAAAHGGRVLQASAIPAPGDLILYGHGTSASVHVGVVVQVLPDGRIVTVEGNYAGKVTRVGPFKPADAQSEAGEAGPVYGFAQPPAGRSAG